MEKAAVRVKSFIAKITGFFEKTNIFLKSTETLRRYDKTIKFLKKFIPALIIYFLLICFSYVFIYPLLRASLMSIMSTYDLDSPDVFWFPIQPTLDNFNASFITLGIFKVIKEGSAEGAQILGYSSTLWNTILYATIIGVIQTFVSGLTGYAFARFDFRFKKIWFALLILSFIIPVQLLILPKQLILQPLIKAASNAPLIVNILQKSPMMLVSLLGVGINSAILIFIFFSFFKMIPQALDEAAQIDGASFPQIFWHIIIKMSVSTITVVFLFSFVWNWNDSFMIHYLSPTNIDSKRVFETITQSMKVFDRSFQDLDSESFVDPNGGSIGVNVAYRAAAIVIGIVPLALFYGIAQKKFVEGIENTGVTGI